MAARAQIDNQNEDKYENTFSDFSEDSEQMEIPKTNNKDNESDEFDIAFSEKIRKLKLKPSEAQQTVNKKVEPIEPEPNENDVTIQTPILSDYLKPTNILSKYQQQNYNDHIDDEDIEAEEIEEKVWRMNQNTYDDDENINYNEEPNEEKCDFDPIDYQELLPLLIKEADIEIDQDDIIVEDFRNIGWFPYIKAFIFGGCTIALKSNRLNDERDNIFKIAKLKLDLNNVAHNRMLQTLWMKLTDDTRSCDKTGSHWQQIGFQANDPCTDIRGCGLFGILQLVYMIETYDDIISKIYLLSINEHQNFPFVIVSFTISGIVIRLLRSCLLYNHINSIKSVTDSVNVIYVALFYEFYLKWKNKCRTIISFDDAQKELEKDTFANWSALIDQLKKRENSIDYSDDEEIPFGASSSLVSKYTNMINSKRHNQYEM